MVKDKQGWMDGNSLGKLYACWENEQKKKEIATREELRDLFLL